MKAAIYARVSTTDQNCELQLAELREYIRRHGWDNAGEYVDTGWSGAKVSGAARNGAIPGALGRSHGTG